MRFSCASPWATLESVLEEHPGVDAILNQAGADPHVCDPLCRFNGFTGSTCPCPIAPGRRFRALPRAEVVSGSPAYGLNPIGLAGRNLRPHCQSGALVGGELEREVGREPIRVAFNLLVQALGRYALEIGQIRVEHPPLAADGQNAGIERGRRRELVSHQYLLRVLDVYHASTGDAPDCPRARVLRRRGRPHAACAS